MKTNLKLKHLFICFIFLSSSAHSAPVVEHSTTPIVEYFESIENIPTEKFTTHQMKELTSALNEKEHKIRIVTYNMLFNIKDDTIEEKYRWPHRLPRIVELVKEMNPDIISTQELYPDQVQDICNLLKEDFEFFPGKRERIIPGKTEKNGESYGIFYRKNRFKLLSSDFIDPLAMIQLQDLNTQRIFAVFNTHLPLLNSDLRESLANQILEIIGKVSEKMPTLFTGDLNTFPNRLEFNKLPSNDGDHIHQILSKGRLKNSEEKSLLGHFGPISTFTNFDPDNIKPFAGTGTPGVILDHIYVSEDIHVLAHAVEKGRVNGHFPSDHMPVFIDFIFAPSQS